VRGANGQQLAYVYYEKSVEVRFIREIVWPDGRREISGVTPKALPSPDASTDPTDNTNEGAA
jgi:hypothetical protein